MNNLRNINNIFKKAKICEFSNKIGLNSFRYYSSIIDPPDEVIMNPPERRIRENESLERKKARLVYQSRKRGMLENDLLLSTFAAKYLNQFTAEQIDEYDKLINLPSNDWDIFYWASDIKPIPKEFDSEIMQLLRQHCKNIHKESRVRQPDL